MTLLIKKMAGEIQMMISLYNVGLLSPDTTRHIGANISVAPTPEASAVLDVLRMVMVKKQKDGSSNHTLCGVSGQDQVEND